MIDRDALLEITEELARDTADMPALFVDLGIDEETFMQWSHEGADAAMAEVTIAMLGQNVNLVEKSIHAVMISMFIVGFKAGQRF